MSAVIFFHWDFDGHTRKEKNLKLVFTSSVSSSVVKIIFKKFILDNIKFTNVSNSAPLLLLFILFENEDNICPSSVFGIYFSLVSSRLTNIDLKSLTQSLSFFFFFLYLKRFYACLFVSVPWKLKQQEWVSHHIMSIVILETMNVDVFSTSFDREDKVVKEGNQQAWRHKDFELTLWVPPPDTTFHAIQLSWFSLR